MNKIIYLIQMAQRNPFHFQSNYAREHAYIVAECASRGYITCLQGGMNMGLWMITEKGVNLLEATTE